MIMNLNFSSKMDNVAYCRVSRSEHHKISQYVFMPEHMSLMLTHIRDFNFKQLHTRNDRISDRPNQKKIEIKLLLLRQYLPGNIYFCVSSGKLFPTAAASSRGPDNTISEGPSGASDNRKIGKLSLSLRPAPSRTTQKRARELGKLTKKIAESLTLLSRTCSEEIHPLKLERNEVAPCTSNNYKT